jgi:hypothetical protein
MKLAQIAMGIVLCGSQALAQPAATEMTATEARVWLEDYVRIWSSDRDVNIATVNKYYAPVVTYYGRQMGRNQVLDDKLRYIRRYPVRSYKIVEGTVAVACNTQRTMCTTSGVMQIQLVDRDGRTLSRMAKLLLTMSSAAGGQIIRESAVNTR